MSETVLPPMSMTSAATSPTATGDVLIQVENLSLYYGPAKALKNINLTLREKLVTAFIGPSGCGKSTLLRCLNRMNDLIDGVKIEGSIKIGGHDIYAPDIDVIELR